MIKTLEQMESFARDFRVSVKFKGEWVKVADVSYKTLSDDDLFEFYTLVIGACSQPRA